MSKYKHFFFDMDGTITDSRQKISFEMNCIFENLMADIIVISGAEKRRILEQLNYFQKPLVSFNIMAQSGGHTDYWEDSLSPIQKEEIRYHIQKIAERFPYLVPASLYGRETRFQDRGCQFTFGFLPPDEDINLKKAFDPIWKVRKTILKEVPFVSLTGLKVSIAGTTSLDYTKDHSTKGRNIEKFIEYKGWNKKECIYFGDALFKGGNDESVVGIIDTVSVIDYKDTIKKLEQYV